MILIDINYNSLLHVNNTFIYLLSSILQKSEAYLEPSQTSTMVHFCENS